MLETRRTGRSRTTRGTARRSHDHFRPMLRITRRAALCAATALGAAATTVPQLARAQEGGPPDPQLPSLCDALTGNLVRNCGFETGDFREWFATNEPFLAVFPNYAHTGAYGAGSGAIEGKTPGRDVIRQTLVTQPGQTYQITFYARNLGRDGSDSNNRLQFLFGGVGFLDQDDHKRYRAGVHLRSNRDRRKHRDRVPELQHAPVHGAGRRERDRRGSRPPSSPNRPRLRSSPPASWAPRSPDGGRHRVAATAATPCEPAAATKHALTHASKQPCNS